MKTTENNGPRGLGTQRIRRPRYFALGIFGFSVWYPMRFSVFPFFDIRFLLIKKRLLVFCYWIDFSAERRPSPMTVVPCVQETVRWFYMTYDAADC